MSEPRVTFTERCSHYCSYHARLESELTVLRSERDRYRVALENTMWHGCSRIDSYGRDCLDPVGGSKLPCGSCIARTALSPRQEETDA